MSEHRSKYWCFTLNNPKDKLTLWDDLVYRVYQKEKGNETGTEHFQGFAIFKKKFRVSELIKRVNSNDFHWEKMKATAEEARAYCMKEDTRVEGPWEEGCPWEDICDKIGKGKRNDLLKVKEDIDKGMPLKTLYDQHFETFASYNKFFERYKFLKEFEESKKLRNVEVTLYWGVAGSGKTYRAFQNNPDAYILHRSNNGMWWPGYDRQKTVIFDDFDGTWMPISTLLRLLDKYPMHVEDKGTCTPACWTKVIITSNQPIEDWYPDAYKRCPERLEAVKRRIHSIVRFDNVYVPKKIYIGRPSIVDETLYAARQHMRDLDDLYKGEKLTENCPVNLELGTRYPGKFSGTKCQTQGTVNQENSTNEIELIPLNLDSNDSI